MTSAPTERGWGRLLLALAAFVFVPTIPQMRALLPIEQTMFLLVPALAACFLVGWWAGGRALMAIGWVALATWMMWQRPAEGDAYINLARGWSLLLGGAFGLVCLFGARRSVFSRSMLALSVALFLAFAMSAMGPITVSEAKKSIKREYLRRNSETMTHLNAAIGEHPVEWKQLTEKLPKAAELPAQIEQQLALVSSGGVAVFPALLALQSLLGLALAWSIYHRLSRARLGAPLRPLRDFRFNDQLVWGLIVGLTIVFLPTLTMFRGVGRNLLVFFGALYAIRGLGVLAWFLAPGAFTASLAIGFGMLLLPIPQAIAGAVTLLIIIAVFGLGLGDTWVDWRRRARTTT